MKFIENWFRSDKKKQRTFVTIMGMVAIVAIVSTISMSSISNIQRSQYRERASSADILMEKIGQNVDTAVISNWEYLRYLKAELEREEVESEARLAAKLRFMSQDANRTLWLVDDDYTYVSSDGTSGTWNAVDRIESGEDEFFISDIQYTGDDEYQLFYITPFREPVEVEGRRFTHIVLVRDMQLVDSFFDVSSYGDDSVAYIVHRDGRQIYQEEKDNELSEIRDILGTLEDARFLYGASLQKVREDIASQQNGTVNLIYEGKSYYLSYFHMDVDDWSILLLVPQEDIAGGTDSLTEAVTWNVSTIFIGMMAAILIVIGYTVMRNRINQQEVEEQLRAAANAERAANQAKTDFLSSMSHDIRTPMNAIINLTDMAIVRSEDHQFVKESLQKIMQSSRHLLMLINDILDISKVESGKMTISPSSFQVSEMMNTMLEMVKPQIKASGLTFNVRVHEMEQEQLYGDVLRLNQIFVNLISNAIKYNKPDGQIDIDLYEEPAEDGFVWFKFICADTGIGMSEEFQKTMYDSFTRGTDSRINKISGSGLGLAICHQMVELMDGTVDCDSKLGEGTTFTVRVKLQISEKDENLRLPEKNILLVDDDEIFRESTKEMLLSLGTRVTAVEDGYGAIRAMEEGFYDVMIIDKQLDDIDGIKVTRRIHTEFGEGFPVIIASAYDTSEFEKEALEAGAAAVLTKPIFKSTLYHVLREVLHIENVPVKVVGNPGSPEDIKGMHILCAEDNEMNWEILQVILDMYDVTYERVENGEKCVQAVENAAPGTYDVILMDVRMPVMDGRTATKILRESEQEWIRELPILAMTADAFAEDYRASIEAGMTDHLTKPIDRKQLVQKLSEVYSSKKSGGVPQKSVLS